MTTTGASAGADLPVDYPTAEARVLVANPTTVWAEWGRHDHASSFVLRALVDGTTEVSCVEVPGHSRDAWVTVWPGSRGVLTVDAVGPDGNVRLAELPFATPVDGPSSSSATRWGRLDAYGNLHRDAPPVEGKAVSALAGQWVAERSTYGSASVLRREPVDGEAR